MRPNQTRQQTGGAVSVSPADLRDNPVPPPWLGKLLEGPALPLLTTLNLRDIPNLGPALTNAAEAARHRRLKRLDVSGIAFRSAELRRLLTSSCLSKLEELDLTRRTLLW